MALPIHLASGGPSATSGRVGIVVLTSAIITASSANAIALNGFADHDASALTDRTGIVTSVPANRGDGRHPAMTALTAILGLLPLLLFQMHGTEIERPLAIVMIGGLVTSTLFTLLALPTFYLFVHDLGEVWGRGDRAEVQSRARRSSCALTATMTVLADISTAANAGGRRMPWRVNTPAASGIATML